MKKLPKKSIQRLTWLYFLMLSVVIVGIIMGVELIFTTVFSRNQTQRTENLFKDSHELAIRMKAEFERYGQEIEPGSVGYKSLSEYKEEADRLVQKYDGEIEFYVFSYNESSEGMDIYDALGTFTPYNGDAGYYTSNEHASNNAKTDVFVANPQSSLAEEIFRIYAYNYNIYRDREAEKGIFYYSDIDFGTNNATSRIYGGSLAEIAAGKMQIRIALYMRVTVVKKEIGVNAILIAVFSAAVFALALSFILSTLLSNKISHPIRQYADAAESLGRGNYRQKIDIDKKSFFELQQLGQAFNQAAEEIEKTDTQRKEFLANVTHDLRTPLTMIRAYAEMIRDISGANELKRKTHSQIIIDEADRLSLLVEDILNVSKLEAGTLKMEFVPTDMTTLCKTALSLYNIKVEKEGYKIVSELEEGAVAVADGQRITQVIHNLVQNAVNYTGEDKTVTVRLKKIENGVRIEVSDSGVGIAPEEIESVWTRYYQINQKKRNKMGSGLGLDIARGILTSHNARFGIESELGKGTTFWFELDNKAPDEAENQ